MSYNARSSIVAMAAIAAVYGAYFWWASAPGRSAWALMTHMVGAIVVLAVVITVLEIAIAIIDRRSAAAGRRSDERDISIATRAARNGYFALLSVVWLAPILPLAGASRPLMANAFLAMIVFAELVNFGSRVFYDRRGA